MKNTAFAFIFLLAATSLLAQTPAGSDKLKNIQIMQFTLHRRVPAFSEELPRILRTVEPRRAVLPVQEPVPRSASEVSGVELAGSLSPSLLPEAPTPQPRQPSPQCACYPPPPPYPPYPQPNYSSGVIVAGVVLLLLIVGALAAQ